MIKTIQQVHIDTRKYNKALSKGDKGICDVLAETMPQALPGTEK